MAEKVVKGMAQLKRNLATFRSDVDNVAVKAVYEGLRLIQNDAKRNHSETDVSRYTDRTGNLTNSIQAETPEALADSVTGEVTAGMEYAQKVEQGSSNTRAYPFMIPALEANRRDIKSELESLIKSIKWVK